MGDYTDYRSDELLHQRRVAFQDLALASHAVNEQALQAVGRLWRQSHGENVWGSPDAGLEARGHAVSWFEVAASALDGLGWRADDRTKIELGCGPRVEPDPGEITMRLPEATLEELRSAGRERLGDNIADDELVVNAVVSFLTAWPWETGPAIERLDHLEHLERVLAAERAASRKAARDKAAATRAARRVSTQEVAR